MPAVTAPAPIATVAPPVPLKSAVEPPVSDTPTAPIPGSLPGDAVRAFEAPVRRSGPVSERFDSRTAKRTVVYVINSTTCSFCHDYIARLKDIEAKYMPRGVDVIHVYPNRSESDADKVAWHAKQGFRGGQILDAQATVAKLLEAEKTPTVYVVDRKGLIVYRGGVDDSPSGEAVTIHPLADALDAILSGKSVEVSSFEAPG